MPSCNLLRFKLLLRHTVSAALVGTAAISLPGRAQVTKPDANKPDAVNAEAVSACERSARQTLSAQAGQTGPAIDVSFGPAPSMQRGLSNEDQVVLRGTGRARSATGSRNFSYSCNVDLRTSDAVGLVLRDTSPVAAAPEPVRAATAEPDLTALSPSACESSAVEQLQQRWPRVSQINFETSTRIFSQQSSSKAELHGTGRAMPMPGAPSALFVFDCQLDPRSGRVLRTNISG